MKCKAVMVSKAVPDHIHRCSGEHDAGDHMCSDPTCRRWFWQNPQKKRYKPKKVTT